MSTVLVPGGLVALIRVPESVVMAAAVAAQWLANLAVSWSFKVIDGAGALNARFHHGFAYWLYGAFSIAALLFVWRFVPETKGRTLESIGALWIERRWSIRSVSRSE